MTDTAERVVMFPHLEQHIRRLYAISIALALAVIVLGLAIIIK